MDLYNNNILFFLVNMYLLSSNNQKKKFELFKNKLKILKNSSETFPTPKEALRI